MQGYSPQGRDECIGSYLPQIEMPQSSYMSSIISPQGEPPTHTASPAS
jgi:hypothetical protein